MLTPLNTCAWRGSSAWVIISTVRYLMNLAQVSCMYSALCPVFDVVTWGLTAASNV